VSRTRRWRRGGRRWRDTPGSAGASALPAVLPNPPQELCRVEDQEVPVAAVHHDDDAFGVLRPERSADGIESVGIVGAGERVRDKLRVVVRIPRRTLSAVDVDLAHVDDLVAAQNEPRAGPRGQDRETLPLAAEPILAEDGQPLVVVGVVRVRVPLVDGVALLGGVDVA